MSDLTIGQKWEQASGAKKAAIIGGAVAGAAAVASLAYAAKTGKTDTFMSNLKEGTKQEGFVFNVKKGAAKVADGYKKLGGKIVELWNKAKSHLPKGKEKVEQAAEQAAQGAQ